MIYIIFCFIGDLRRHYSQHHDKAHGLLECDQCNKVFATQKCLSNHKTTHNRDIETKDFTVLTPENQDIMNNRNYTQQQQQQVPRF